jgi:Holliday junction resolvase RusA-like endonuclease
MICFPLIFPPSLNNLFPDGTGRRVPSRRYKAWQAEAGYMVPRAAKGLVPGHFNATLTFDRPDRRKRDLDNLAKATLDLLKSTGVIVGDHLAERITLAWSSPYHTPVISTQPMVHVAIEPLIEAQP